MINRLTEKVGEFLVEKGLFPQEHVFLDEERVVNCAMDYLSRKGEEKTYALISLKGDLAQVLTTYRQYLTGVVLIEVFTLTELTEYENTDYRRHLLHICTEKMAWLARSLRYDNNTFLQSNEKQYSYRNIEGKFDVHEVGIELSIFLGIPYEC